MKRTLLAFLFAVCLLPVVANAQESSTPELVSTLEPSPAPVTVPDITFNVSAPPAPTVAPTDSAWTGIGILVAVIIAVISLVVAVIRNPTALGLTAALQQAQANRPFVDALEGKFQAAPLTTQEALTTAVAVLRLILGFVNSPAIRATIAFLEDIQTPGLPSELVSTVAGHDARLDNLEAQLDKLTPGK